MHRSICSEMCFDVSCLLFTDNRNNHVYLLLGLKKGPVVIWCFKTLKIRPITIIQSICFYMHIQAHVSLHGTSKIKGSGEEITTANRNILLLINVALPHMLIMHIEAMITINIYVILVVIYLMP